MVHMNPEMESAKVQRDQFAYYIVRIAVAIGMVDGKDSYTGDQVAFLADTAIKAICKRTEQTDQSYAAERLKVLDSMPSL